MNDSTHGVPLNRSGPMPVRDWEVELAWEETIQCGGVTYDDGQRVLGSATWLSILSALVLGVALASAAWYFTPVLAKAFKSAPPTPLLADDFPERGPIDSDKWAPLPEVLRKDPYGGAEAGIRAMDGKVRLTNRGYLITQKEYAPPIEVSFDWMYDMSADDPKYADILTVALRTSGRPETKRPYEVEDGFKVAFQSFGGRIAMKNEGKQGEQLRYSKDRVRMNSLTWIHVRVVDDGERVAVYVHVPDEEEAFRDKPIFVRECPGDGFRQHRVAIYNREWVSCKQVSFIKNLRILPAQHGQERKFAKQQTVGESRSLTGAEGAVQ